MRVNHWIDGRITDQSDARRSPVYNPATGEVTGSVALATSEVVDQAVAAAQRAFPEWAATSPLRRARVMFRFKQLIEDNHDRLAECITREHGKLFTDARGEVTRGLEVVEYACGIPGVLKGEYTEQIAGGIDA